MRDGNQNLLMGRSSSPLCTRMVYFCDFPSHPSSDEVQKFIYSTDVIAFLSKKLKEILHLRSRLLPDFLCLAGGRWELLLAR